MQVPPGHWLLGHLPKLRTDPLGLLMQCEGDVVPLRLGGRAWLILHPQDILHVLEHSESRYTKGAAFRFGRKLYGNSLLVSEGAEHREQVKLIGGLFYRHAAEAFLQPAVEITQRWLDRWKPGESFDLWSSLVELTLAISSRAIFGNDYLPVWLTGKDNPQNEQILVSYDVAMGHVARQTFSLLPLPTWLPTPASHRYRKAIHTLNSAFRSSVERRQAQPGQVQGGFLDVLLNAHLERPEILSLQQVRDQALVLLLGGYESTATALCWTILLISKHDSVRQALQQEVEQVVTTDFPQAKHARSLSYTGRVFSEALRLYPPPWLIPRCATCPDTLPSGHQVSKGAQLFVSPFRTQRDPGLFEYPLQFDPDRFQSDKVATMIPGSYFPFGAGPRGCIGETIARAQVALILATMFRNHRFRLQLADFPRPAPLLTLRPAPPVTVCCDAA